MAMLNKFLSYFIPINIYKRKSAVSTDLEVTWANGELVLDSKNTNYSYGSLQRILRKGLLFIGMERVAAMENILLLGVAGGSVIKTLVDEIHCKAKITGVEIDAAVIALANQYFKLDQIPNVTIEIDDAFEFVLKTKESYDLIIVDVFQDTVMPSFLFEGFFADRLCHLLKQNGIIMFNTMILNPTHEKRNLDYIAHFSNMFNVTALPRIERHNEVIIIEKI